MQAISVLPTTVVADPSSGSSNERSEQPSPIATVNGEPIDADAVRNAMVRQGADFLDRFETLAAKLDVVEDLVRIEILAQNARADGYADHPRVRAAINAVLAEHYWRDQVAALSPLPVTDADVRSYYEAHPQRFSRPERRRGAIVRWRIKREASDADRAALRERAHGVAATAVGTSRDRFAALARTHSDDLVTRERGGDMGFVVHGASVFRFETPVIEALFAIDAPGGVSSLVETDRAFSLIRLTETLGGGTAPLASVHEDVRRLLEHERLHDARATRYAALRGQADVEIDTTSLRTIGPTDLADGYRPPAFPSAEARR